jgi:hypothetical protein
MGTKPTYQDLPNGSINVRLEGRVVGTIKRNGIFWCYYPKGSSVPGDSYGTIAGVKKSLEAE